MVQGLNRRNFQLLAVYGLTTIIGAALAIPAAVYLLFPPRIRKRSGWVEAGDLAKMSAGEPQEVVYRRRRTDGWKVTDEKASAWVLKTGDSAAVAFSPICTHLGCAVHWDKQNKNFLCPCHTSTFGVDGKVLSGPAPRALDRLETKVEGTKLLLGQISTAQNV